MSKLFGRSDVVGGKSSRRRFLTVPVPFDDEGRSVRLRNLTAKEHGEYEITNLSKKGGLVRERLLEAKRLLVVKTMCDADGNLCCDEADVLEMEETDGRLVAFIYGKACEHCGITDAEVEDAVKNSGAIGGDSSASDSPKNSALKTPTLTPGLTA
jgi:hypothetical protein